MRGFFFAVTAILFFSLLAASVVVLDKRSAASLPWAEWLTLEKIASSVDDIDEDLPPVLDLNLTYYQNNLSITDRLPASHNISRSLSAYAQFVQSYYAPPSTSATFLSVSGQPLALDQLSLPLQILPSGLNYSYPDWGKRELQIVMHESNFTQLFFLGLNFTVTNASFDQNFSMTCEEEWDEYRACGKKTKYCLNASLRVADQNGSAYAAPCTSFDVSYQNKLRIKLTQNRWLEVRLGRVEHHHEHERLVEVRFQDLDVTANTVFSLNQTPSLNMLAQVRVTDLATNSSLAKVV